VTPAPLAGWNNTDTTVSWNLADGLSGIFEQAGCDAITFTAETTGTTSICTATDQAGNSASTSVTVKLDKTVPVTVSGSATAILNPVAVNNTFTLSATITDSGGSGVGPATAYNVDGGATFTAMTGTFGGATADVTAIVPAFTTAGIHTLCVRGADVASNLGAATECVIVAVYDPTGGFATGGGTVTSPAGADLANPTATGKATFGFVSKYLPGTTTPAGNLEFQFQEGNLNFKSTSMELLVVTAEPRAQFTGTGTINGTTACKFDVDAWDASFGTGQPKVDAFGLKIHSCDPGGGQPSFTRYNLAPTTLTKGNIVIHQ
jgi:hypothetical protein